MSAVRINPSSSADEINVEWDKLTTKLDQFYNSLPVDVRNVVNKAITDWQDFYFGNAGAWPQADLEKWTGIFSKASETLSAAIKPGAKAETTPVASKQASKTSADTTFFVRGQVEPAKIPDVVIPKFADLIELKTPKWLLPVMIGVPGLFILYQMSKSKRGRA